MLPQKNLNWGESGKMANPQAAFSLAADEKLFIMEALDHIHVTRQYQDMGLCSVCKKISVKKCSACGTFYCSSECQTYDWPKHKVVCSRQRDNLSDRNSSNSNKNILSGSVKNLTSENMMRTDRSSPFTVLASQINKSSGSEYSGSKTLPNYKIGNKQYQNRENTSKVRDPLASPNDGKEHKKSNTFEKAKNVSPKKSNKNNNNNNNNNNHKKWEEFAAGEKPVEKKGNGSLKNNTKNNGNRSMRKSLESSPVSHVTKQTSPVLPKIEKMNVIGTYRESTLRYWVMDLNNLSKYEKIQIELNKNDKNYTLITPKLGLWCSCCFGGEWFRGKIVSLSPEISVHFIDYGNTSKFDHSKFRKLPDSLHSIPPLAFLIEFEENTSNYYKTSDLESIKFTIKGTGTSPDGVPRVEVIEEETTAEETDSTPKEVKTLLEKFEKVSIESKRSVMDTITSDSEGMIILMSGEEMTRYGSLVPKGNENAEKCVEKILNIENSSSTPIEAAEGEYVLVVDKEGNDQRGKILTNLGSTFYVQLVDCGEIISTDCVYPLSDELKELIELGVKINIEKILSESQLKRVENGFFAITGECKAGKWPCVLKDTDHVIFAKGSLEKPIENVPWRPQYVYLKSGATVEVSSTVPPNSFYIRAVDVETEQKFLNMNMELIQYVSKANGFAIPPSPGELCCAKFLEDGCFYRGIVNSFERGKANILFVDFGNEQETALADLKPLSASLKSFPFFAVKVKLSNISQKPWNNMIKEYIIKLTSENIELTLTYEDSISNGVTLREKVSGIVVNEFIEKARDRSRISQSLKSGSHLSTKTEIFLDDDMEYTTIANTTKCDFAVLYVCENEFANSYRFWGTIAGLKNFDYVNLELNSLISDHCSNVSAPYEPSCRELCLAEYEGSWYRAICAAKNGNNFKVVFVDFGNVCELKATSIRKMVKKFMKAPALAMNCTVNGHEKLKNNPELTKKVFGILFERVNTCFENVEIEKFKEDSFLVKIPEIEKLIFG